MKSYTNLLPLLVLLALPAIAMGQAGNKWVKYYTQTPGYNFTARTTVVDAAGNVIISGEKWIDPFNYDIVTVKYDSVGNELWNHVYAGVTGSYDIPVKALADNSGNIYIAGTTYSSSNAAWLLMKLDPAGTLLWSDTTTNPPQGSGGNVLNDMQFDNAGNIVLAGSIQRDLTFPTTDAAMAVVKYDPSGNELWRNVTVVDYADNKIRKIAIDQSNNIYAVGYEFHGSPPGQRFVVRKYSAAGGILWQDVFDFDSTMNEMETGMDIKIDAAGNIYAAGTASKNSDAHRDFLLRKYNPSGAVIWTNTYTSAVGANHDEMLNMYLAPNGNAYITGITKSGSGGPEDIMTIKVDSAGVQQWSRTYGYSIGNADLAAGIAGEAVPENVAVTGTSRRDGFYVDAVTIRYNANGDTIWTKRQPSTAQAEAQSVYIGADHDVYVTGHDAHRFLTMRIQTPNATVTKDISGAGLYDFTGPGNATALSLDFTGANTSSMFVSLLYNRVANTDWCTGTTAPLYLSKYRWVAHALALNFTSAVLRIDMGLLQSALPGGHGITDFTKYAIYQRALDGIGEFCKLPTTYVNGKLEANITSLSEFFIGSETDSFSYTLDIPNVSTIGGLKVYPHPSDLSSTISYDLPQGTDVKVALIDITGKEVMTVYRGYQEGGAQQVHVNTAQLPAGLYLCRIVAGSRTGAVKISVVH